MKAKNRLLEFALHGIFAVLFVMSVILYKERLFADSAYFFFHAINSGCFHVEHGRILLGLTQITPLIGYYLQLPLQFLLILNAVGHELFYYGVCLLLFYKLNDHAAALAVLVLHLMGQLWLFYVPTLEISYAAALAVLFYALLRNEKYKDEKWFILLLVIEWGILFAHPANLFFIPLILIYDMLKRGWHKVVHGSSWGFFAIAIVVRVLTLSSYDQKKVQGIDNSVSSNVFSLEYWSEVFDVFLTYYPDLLILTTILFVFLIWKKQFIELALFVLATIFFLLATSIVSPLNQFSFYIEVLLLTVVFVGVFFVLFSFWDKLKGTAKTVSLLLILSIVFFRIYWIWDFGQVFRDRMIQLERVVDYAQTLGGSKYMIDKENLQRSYSNVSWANPIEALLISAIDRKEHTLSLITNDDLEFENNQKRLSDSTFIFRRFEVENHSFLNEKYFQLDKEAYGFLNQASLSVINDEFIEKIKIEPYREGMNYTFSTLDTIHFPVRIINDNEEPLPSKMEGQIFLSYHWYKEGDLHEWDGFRTPIEVDVWHSHVQDIMLAIPKVKGSYELRFDVVIEGEMWFELEGRVKVIVN